MMEIFFENTEQLDGHVSLSVDSYSNRSDKVQEPTEEEMAHTHLPTADDPDNVIQNWIDSSMTFITDS